MRTVKPEPYFSSQVNGLGMKRPIIGHDVFACGPKTALTKRRFFTRSTLGSHLFHMGRGGGGDDDVPCMCTPVRCYVDLELKTLEMLHRT